MLRSSVVLLPTLYGIPPISLHLIQVLSNKQESSIVIRHSHIPNSVVLSINDALCSSSGRPYKV